MKTIPKIQSFQDDLHTKEIEVLENSSPQISCGTGQCLVGGCSCAAMKGMSICSNCGHYDTDHQDIG